MVVECPKCGYARKPSDDAPQWQCPSCKVAYNKALKTQNSAASAVPQVAESSEEETGVRAHGIKMLFLGGLGAFIYTLIALFLNTKNYSIHGIGWGIPGAYALAGLIQTVSGVPFTQLSDKWDDLKGWQRGVLGLIAIVVSFFIFIFAVVIFA
jgi:hypothetical protein